MKNLISGMIAGALAILFSGCEENLVTKYSAVDFKQTGVYEGPSRFGEGSNGDGYPYPEIIYQVFIPKNDLYHRKTLAWRITWPTYADDADPEKIPSVWSGNGILHSIDYLNSVDPQNTYNTLFSIYFDETIQRTTDVAGELDYVAGAPAGIMDTVSFNGNWITTKALQQMAQSDATGFQMYWQLPNPVEELEYEDEDILFYKIGGPYEDKLYGAIRIVSMEPRIIEVFLAVPQGLSSVDDLAN